MSAGLRPALKLWDASAFFHANEVNVHLHSINDLDSLTQRIFKNPSLSWYEFNLKFAGTHDTMQVIKSPLVMSSVSVIVPSLPSFALGSCCDVLNIWNFSENCQWFKKLAWSLHCGPFVSAVTWKWSFGVFIDFLSKLRGLALMQQGYWTCLITSIASQSKLNR